MGENKPDILQGTLDLMVLKTLESMGPLHGHDCAAHVVTAKPSSSTGTIYRLRLGLTGSRPSGSQITAAPAHSPGKGRIAEETRNWERVAATMALFLDTPK